MIPSSMILKAKLPGCSTRSFAKKKRTPDSEEPEADAAETEADTAGEATDGDESSEDTVEKAEPAAEDSGSVTRSSPSVLLLCRRKASKRPLEEVHLRQTQMPKVTP